MAALGERIRKLREDKDLSLRELARLLELSAAFLSDIELGRRYPSDAVLTKIAKKLQTTVDDLRTYDTRPPVEELKRLASSDPVYGIAMRRIVERVDNGEITPDELLKLINRRRRRQNREEP